MTIRTIHIAKQLLALALFMGCAATALRAQIPIADGKAPPRAASAASYDVVIYGGTPAGLMAGVAASREGASVLVIEPGRWLGGMVAGGLCRTDFGNQRTIGGLAREYFDRAADKYNPKVRWYLEPHVFQRVFAEMLGEAGVPVVKNARLATVETHDGRIGAITAEDGTRYEGKVFIDATYEGDLMARAGVNYKVGREGIETYGEPLAGFRPGEIEEIDPEVMKTVCACLGGKGPHYTPGIPVRMAARDAEGEPYRGVTRTGDAPGAGDGLTQAYNFRVVVTQAKDNLVPFPKPKNYDPARYALLLDYINKFPGIRFGRLVHFGKIANGKFDINNSGFFSTDYIGGNAAYPDGDHAARERIRRDHVDYQQGFFWFLGHDPRVPQSLRDEVNAWGLCRDEFADNGHWPYQLYVREARRMIGAYVMTQRDMIDHITKPDTVAMGSFAFDSHRVQRIETDGGFITLDGKTEDVAKVRPYGVPYRSITPKAEECQNLLVPVCLSASHVACGSLRMEPVYMSLGHASGVAAALAVRAGAPVQKIDITRLREILRRQKQVLELAL
jgi:hypothetical protein